MELGLDKISFTVDGHVYLCSNFLNFILTITFMVKFLMVQEKAEKLLMTPLLRLSILFETRPIVQQCQAPRQTLVQFSVSS